MSELTNYSRCSMPAIRFVERDNEFVEVTNMLPITSPVSSAASSPECKQMRMNATLTKDERDNEINPVAP